MKHSFGISTSLQYIKIVIILLKMREHFSSNLCDSAGVLVGLCLSHLWFPPESARLSTSNTVPHKQKRTWLWAL